jgi:hypothetical protein
MSAEADCDVIEAPLEELFKDWSPPGRRLEDLKG